MIVKSVLFTLAVTAAALGMTADLIDTPPPSVIGVAMATATQAGLNQVPAQTDILLGEAEPIYSAFLYENGVIGCSGWLYTKPETIAPCDNAAELLKMAYPSYFPQDTVPRWVRFVWASDSLVADYQIQVLTLTDSVLLDTIVVTSPLEWTEGAMEQNYKVRGRTRVIVGGGPMPGSYGVEKQFSFPGIVQIPAMPPITVDTLP